MTIKQTPVGSLPRSPELQSAYAAFDEGNLKKAELDKICLLYTSDAADE